MKFQPATLRYVPLAEQGVRVGQMFGPNSVRHGQVQGIFQGSHVAQPDNTEKLKLV